MRIVIENIDEVIARQIALSAEQHQRTPAEEAAEVLKQHFSRDASVARLKALQVELVAQNGGKLFPDSVNDIREMRSND